MTNEKEVILKDSNVGFLEVSINPFHYDELDKKIIELLKLSNGFYNIALKQWILPYTKVNEFIEKCKKENITTKIITLQNDISDEVIIEEFNKIKTINPSFKIYDYQIKGVSFLANRKIAILGDELGLGKTIEALIAAKILYNKYNFKNILVVCYPISIIEDWKKSINTISNDENFKKAFTITNYEQLRSKNAAEITSKTYDLVICDEASQLRNPTLARKGLKEVKSKYYWFLSGEIIEKYPIDFYYIISTFTSFYTKNEFYSKYVITKKKYLYNKVFDEITGFKNLNNLKEEIKPFYLKRTREDVGEQLRKIDIITNYVPCDLLKEQEKRINEIKQEIAIKKKLYNNENYILEYFQKIRLVLDDANYDDPNKPMISSKTDKLSELISKNIGSKIIVFTSYKMILDKLLIFLQSKGIKAIKVSSDMSKEERNEKIKEYKASKDTNVLISSDILAYGINLETSTVMIHYDLPLLGGKLKQRIYRMVRATSQTSVVYNYILTTNTQFDTHVKEILLRKIAYAEAVTKETSSVESLGFTKKDILSVMKKVL